MLIVFLQNPTKPLELFYIFKSISALSQQAGSIGKRYRRQDEIGIPFCLTIDDESLENNMFTIRNRDTMEQERLTLDEIKNKVFNSLKF